MPVRLGAGEEILIKIEAAVATKADGIRLSWESGGGTSIQAECFIRPDSAGEDDAPGATVANTSLAFENPFYAVHLHHPIRAGGAPQSFRVQPSRRCRVEVLDARTGALIAVDADGDGTFRGLGDSIATDVDADGFPDLPADAATGLGEIEILIFPLPGAAPATRDARIELQVKSPAGWKSIAHDILKMPRRP